MSIDNPRSVDSNTFYVDVRVFLEGVQIPHMNAAVSYGTGEPPTCTVTLPASNFLRALPSATKVLITFKDLLPDDKGEYKWRVLFDGELAAINYSISPEGAYLTISAIHSTAYITLMQLLTIPASEYQFQKEARALGNTVFINATGSTKVMIDIIDRIMNSDQYDSMADLVYLLLRNILEAYKDTSSNGKWYWEKLGTDFLGYKIPDRIYGVSEKAKQAQLMEPEIQGGTQEGFEPTNTSTTTSKGLTTTPVRSYETKGSGNLGSTTYTIYATEGQVGTGGETLFGKQMVAEAHQFVLQGTKYQLGSSGYTASDCGQSVKECLQYATQTTLPEFPRYVPDQIIWAKQNGYWVEGNRANEAKAGDAVVVEGDGHVVISDGKGGYWGMSSSANKMTQNPSITGAFNNRVTGYIDLNKYAEDLRGTR